MKADYTRSIKTVSSKVGNFVHLKWKEGNKAVIRRYVKPKLTGNNHQFGSAMKNMVSIWKTCSAGFKNDLKIYTVKRKEHYSSEEIPPHTNFAHFIRFLYNFRSQNPETDLATVSKEDLETAGIPDNVSNIIEQGLLPSIPDAENLTNNW